jgi:hypothetical protein
VQVTTSSSSSSSYFEGTGLEYSMGCQVQQLCVLGTACSIIEFVSDA